MAALAATKVVDGLSGKAFGGKTGAGDDDLAVFIEISGVGGLETRHTGGSILLNLRGNGFSLPERAYGVGIGAV